MIQRVQTLFLLINVIVLSASLFLPVVIENGNIHIRMIDNIVLALTIALSILVSIITILLFTKRKVQIKGTWILVLLGFVLGFELAILKSQSLASTQSLFVNYIFGAPIIQILFSIIANIFIRKDIKLVEDADRLR